MRSSLRIGGSSSTIRIFSGAALMRLPSVLCRLGGRQCDREHCAVPVSAVGRGYGAVHGLDEAARDCQTQTGAGPHLIALLHSVELVEDALEVACGDAGSLVQDLEVDDSSFMPTANRDGAIGRRVLGGIVEQVEQHL